MCSICQHDGHWGAGDLISGQPVRQARLGTGDFGYVRTVHRYSRSSRPQPGRVPPDHSSRAYLSRTPAHTLLIPCLMDDLHEKRIPCSAFRACTQTDLRLRMSFREISLGCFACCVPKTGWLLCATPETPKHPLTPENEHILVIRGACCLLHDKRLYYLDSVLAFRSPTTALLKQRPPVYCHSTGGRQCLPPVGLARHFQLIRAIRLQQVADHNMYLGCEAYFMSMRWHSLASSSGKACMSRLWHVADMLWLCCVDCNSQQPSLGLGHCCRTELVDDLAVPLHGAIYAGYRAESI